MRGINLADIWKMHKSCLKEGSDVTSWGYYTCKVCITGVCKR